MTGAPDEKTSSDSTGGPAADQSVNLPSAPRTTALVVSQDHSPAARRRGRQFAPGVSGNPAGRPRGARNKMTAQVEAIFFAASEAIAQKLIERALKGDPTCLKILAARIAPIEREQAITLDLPRIETTADSQGALSRVIEAVSGGDITPSQGRALADLIATHRHGAEIADLEERLCQLEAEQRRTR